MRKYPYSTQNTLISLQNTDMSHRIRLLEERIKKSSSLSSSSLFFPTTEAPPPPSKYRKKKEKKTRKCPFFKGLREIEREKEGLLGAGDGVGIEREEEVGFLGGEDLGREGEEEDLEGVIPQGPSGNSISFCFPSQQKLNFAKSQKIFCKIIKSVTRTRRVLYYS